MDRRFLTVVALLMTTFSLFPAASRAGDRGAELYRFCAQCHGAEGGGNREYLAPSIAGLDEWYVESQLSKFRAGIRGMHPDDVGGLRMYPMSLHLKTEEEAKSVASYIAGLTPVAPPTELTGGDVATGKTLYAACAACHGPDAAGMENLKSGPLRYSSDWYLLSSLQKYKSRVRGSDPADLTGAQMLPMAATLADDQAMKDVIAYIMTLRDQ